MELDGLEGARRSCRDGPEAGLYLVANIALGWGSIATPYRLKVRKMTIEQVLRMPRTIACLTRIPMWPSTEGPKLHSQVPLKKARPVELSQVGRFGRLPHHIVAEPPSTARNT